jgi:hypothetical protein
MSLNRAYIRRKSAYGTFIAKLDNTGRGTNMPMFKFSDIKFKALIVGIIADNAGTLLLMTMLAAGLVSTGLSEDEVMSRMKSTSGLLLGLILGLSCTVLGGFFAGKIAGRAEVLHGVLVAIAGMAGGHLAQRHRAVPK